eukprot:scaffold4365_cov147-Skeletonema_menzelii.AAC.6
MMMVIQKKKGWNAAKQGIVVDADVQLTAAGNARKLHGKRTSPIATRTLQKRSSLRGEELII